MPQEYSVRMLFVRVLQSMANNGYTDGSPPPSFIITAVAWSVAAVTHKKSAVTFSNSLLEKDQV